MCGHLKAPFCNNMTIVIDYVMSPLRRSTFIFTRSYVHTISPRKFVLPMTSPDLTQWAQSRIEALYSSTSEEDVQKSYDTTFSSTPRIFVNHEESAKQSFKDDVVARRTSAASSKVEWKDVMVVPKDEKKPNEVYTHRRPVSCTNLTVKSGWYSCWKSHSNTISEIQDSGSSCANAKPHYLQC